MRSYAVDKASSREARYASGVESDVGGTEAEAEAAAPTKAARASQRRAPTGGGSRCAVQNTMRLEHWRPYAPAACIPCEFVGARQASRAFRHRAQV
jgi:hypothetical protein